MDEDLLVAHVTEVRGTRIKAKVIQGKNEAHLFYGGELVRNVSVGGYVKIPCGFDLVIGKIDGEYQAERLNLSHDWFSLQYDGIYLGNKCSISGNALVIS